MPQHLLATLPTLALAAVGGGIAVRLGVPVPFLTGPAVLVTLASLAGMTSHVPMRLREGAFLVLGTVMGAGVTPEVAMAARAWPLSFLGLAAMLVAILAVSLVVLTRLFGHDRRTAVLSASPGHLSFVLGLGAQSGADVPAISIAQSIRLLALTLLVPAGLTLMGLSPDSSAAASAGAVLAPLPLAVLLALSALLAVPLTLMRVPAAAVLAAMTVSTLAHGTGLAEGTVPDWLTIPALVVMGALIGTRFSGVTPRLLARHALAGLAVTGVAALCAGVAALAVHAATGLPLVGVLVALAPGGVETMAAIALSVGADPAYVAAHHVARLFFLTALVPLFLGRSGGRPGGPSGSGADAGAGTGPTA